MKAGRKPKLTKELQDRLCELIRAGNYYSVVCRQCGISVSTFNEWLRRGLNKETAGRKTQPIYAAFATAVQKAKAEGEMLSLARIRQAARGGDVIARETITRSDGTQVHREKYSRPDWQADAWFLERRHSIHWRRRDERQITGKDGERVLPPAIDIASMSDEELRNAIADRERAIASRS
ncbi:MAG TPA: helix-turn-helix domain-containing protein [Gemmataceae bacterium]|nr:helix-turn-helix domain-containing protein [Gemmataceae bacterium]